MVLAVDIKDYLIAQGVGTSTNIFAGPIAQDVVTGIGVLEGSGRPADPIANLEFPEIILYVRGVTKPAAVALAQNANAKLNGLIDTTINGVDYRYISASGAPRYEGKDNLGHFVMIVTFNTIKAEEGVASGGLICGEFLCGDVTSICGGV